MTESPSQEIALSTELAGWVAAWRRAHQKAKEWQETADVAKSRITAALDAAGAQVGTIDGQPAVRWTTVLSNRVDGARLRSEHPELAAGYSTPVISQRFHVVTEREATQ
jgi:predicted phage-related endonuclease